ncbi:hypothetical protein RIVERRIDER_65 [Xanthomonas phage RiverRider]|uniref:Uncharacterized protein n=1 Tax=Xanthomonas phage RiverRider TaxID=2108116 RepID=A0A2P1JUW7_9CAUD|nr:hypothetical protein HWB58_gp70 [Xanthomonas phage RiverRider]AVO23146.1 hypothetical protein RIVERRIDER_65 [Xanthomonas phage RiverRider]
MKLTKGEMNLIQMLRDQTNALLDHRRIVIMDMQSSSSFNRVPGIGEVVVEFDDLTDFEKNQFASSTEEAMNFMDHLASLFLKKEQDSKNINEHSEYKLYLFGK